mgnify:CR=1 FL=1
MAITFQDRSLFGMRHADMAPWVPEFIHTYRVCQGLANDTDDLEQMHRHIFGKDGSQGCISCSAALKRKIEYQQEWLE